MGQLTPLGVKLNMACYNKRAKKRKVKSFKILSRVRKGVMNKHFHDMNGRLKEQHDFDEAMNGVGIYAETYK